MVDTLNRLAATIAARRGADAGSSYTASLFAKGLPKIAQKLGEEATETVIAAMQRDPKALTGEAADLLFHLLVLLEASGVPLADVLAELDRREGTSGLDEKASRTAPPAAGDTPRPLSTPAATLDPASAPGIALGGPAPASRRRIRRG
jgi:phosphoribosyl-ATP pyrophosphohydrolase